jgi:hypothetical protein
MQRGLAPHHDSVPALTNQHEGAAMSRKRRILSLATGIALVATVASAYFLGEVLFEGEGTTPGGSNGAVTIPMTVSFSGVQTLPGPEHSKSIKMSVNNTTGHVLFAHKLTVTITTGNEAACPKSWFIAKPQHEADQLLLEGTADAGGSEGTYEIALGEESTKHGVSNSEWQPVGGDVLLEEREEPVNQAGCAGVPIHVKAQLYAYAS